MSKRIFLSPPWMGGEERTLVQEAFDSGYVAPCGPMVDRFEREFSEAVGAPYACALASGTAALDLLFHELGVGRGDTVFCSDLTFVSSIAPAVKRGAEPVFIDCDEATWTMDPDLLEEALRDAARTGRMPKAVVAVDLYGQCCDYGRIGTACQQYGVPLIIDAAEALGAVYCDYRPIRQAQGRSGRNDEGKKDGRNGEWLAPGLAGGRNDEGKNEGAGVSAAQAAWAVVYSFNGNKIITTSGGGMLVSRDAGVIERARKRAQQAREPLSWYEHRELGYNYRMSNIVAAIGVGQLAYLERIIEKKRQIFGWYRDRLGGKGVAFMPEAAYGRCTRWLTVGLLRPQSGFDSYAGTRVQRGSNAAAPLVSGFNRPEGLVQSKGEPETGGNAERRTQNAERATFSAQRSIYGPGAGVMRVIEALERENIEARPVWKPMHMQPVFQGSRVFGGGVGERLFTEGICLPSGAGLEEADVARVCGVIATTKWSQ